MAIRRVTGPSYPVEMRSSPVAGGVEGTSAMEEGVDVGRQQATVRDRDHVPAPWQGLRHALRGRGRDAPGPLRRADPVVAATHDQHGAAQVAQGLLDAVLARGV